MEERRVPRQVPRETLLARLLIDGYFVGSGQILDISGLGVCLQGASAFQMGDDIEVQFELGARGPLRLIGRVVWSLAGHHSDDTKLGMRWTPTGILDRERLLSLIEYAC